MSEPPCTPLTGNQSPVRGSLEPLMPETNPLPKWSLGIHRTPGEIAEIKLLIEKGELPKDTLKQIADAEDAAVYGWDAPKDRQGKRRSQSIGAKGYETGNHFSAILRYEGREAYENAVREIQKRDPKRHALLGLPKLKEPA